jgi:hypothetical protein
MSVKESLRQTGRDFVARSRFIRLCYGQANVWTASVMGSSGLTYLAAESLCRALRSSRADPEFEALCRRLSAFVDKSSTDGGSRTPVFENRILQSFQASRRARAIRKFYSSQPPIDRLHFRKRRNDGDAARQGNVILLKRPSESEKGVLLIKYNEAIEEFPAVFDIGRLASRYQFVLEPSTTNNIEPAFFCYVGCDGELVIETIQPIDLEFYRRFGRGFAAVQIGAGNWVDSDLFRPKDAGPRTYDVVMVGFWGRLKRHHVLFQALQEINDPAMRVALIGYPLERTRAELEAEMREYGVEKYCTLFENIPAAQVSEVLADSKMNLLLSRKEGPNKAIYEGLFCGVPAIVYDKHVGLNLDHVTAQTGILSSDEQLAANIRWMREHWSQFAPRQWALANAGYAQSTAVINSTLRDLANRSGRPWTTDIVAKINRPQLRYKHEEDRLAMEDGYRDLAEFLI